MNILPGAFLNQAVGFVEVLITQGVDLCGGQPAAHQQRTAACRIDGFRAAVMFQEGGCDA